MFRKLVSNLPYSPSLINQVGFYAIRLKQENFSRKLGMFFGIFALLVQTLVIFAPPEQTLATSTNDIVYGGITKGLKGETPQQTMARIWRSGGDTRNSDIKTIFAHFGITSEQQILDSSLVTISSADRELHSLGRERKHVEDDKVVINGRTYWLRPLYVWDVINDVNTYQALKIRNKDVWIMLSCGNIVVKNPTPVPDIHKFAKPAPGSSVKPGDTIEYRIDHANEGTLGIDQYVVEDIIDPKTTFVSMDKSDALRASFTGGPVPGANKTNVPHAWWTWTGYAPRKSGRVTLTVNVNETAKNGDKICNTAYVRGNGVESVKSETICHTVKVPQPESQYNIELIKESVNGSTFKVGDTVVYQIALRNTGDATLTNLEVTDNLPQGLLYKGGSKYFGTFPSLSPGQSVEFTFDTKVTSDIAPSVVNTSCVLTTQNATACDSEEISVPPPPTPTRSDPREPAPPPSAPEIVLAKTAVVSSAPDTDPRSTDADGKTVNANEVITYTLLTKNNGEATKDNYVVEEDLSDVLEYADLTDTGGGKLNNEGILSWSAIDIKGGETASHSFRVTVKSTIPATPTSASDPDSFDLIMNNVYGNEVNIKLQPPAGKRVEQAVKELPNTGIGTNIAITAGFFITVSYFYNRNKQLLDEIRMLKREYSHGV